MTEVKIVHSEWTFDAYMVKAHDPRPQAAYSQRKGQWAYNLLGDFKPQLARNINGVYPLDPFYDDSNLPHFFKYVEEHWNDNETEATST